MTKSHTPYYITTTAPYVNSSPHIGFGLEILAADAIARYKRMSGYDVLFGTGTDVHGLKIYQKSQELQVTPQEYVDQNAATFERLGERLNLSLDLFQRTTNKDHILAAQTFWKKCFDNGDIYKKGYEVKYCVGCEMEKTDSEIEDNECPLHPGRELEHISEENYFFRFSDYQDKLLKLYEQEGFVLPQSKLREIQSFVQGGLKDFSISRLKKKMPWGVPVPGDEEHVMYVWFDALVFYISTLGWPNDVERFSTYWPGIQIAGKDNLRQQSAMWQAMLMSAGLSPSKAILINGFISISGQKMSKSLGNVISPESMITTYGVDATRYLILRLGPISSDIDISWEQFDQMYSAHLANSLGNTVQRVATLCSRSEFQFPKDVPPGFRSELTSAMNSYDIAGSLEVIWEKISFIEKYIDSTQPWRLEGKKLHITLIELVAHLRQVGYELQPFMPQTGLRILDIFEGPLVTVPEPLFPRLN